MNTPVYPDYRLGSLGLISSIAKYFGAPTGHETLPAADALLEGSGCRSVVMYLFDGMSVDALNRHLPPDSFLRKHLVTDISASYPSTTTAATTTLESGLSPAEHGWLGWSLYIPELDRQVDLFPNRDSETGEPAADFNVARHFMPYQSIFSRINEAGQADARLLSAFSDPPVEGLEAMRRAVIDTFKSEGRHYLYAYWNDPDHTMHEEGVNAEGVRTIIRDIDTYIASLARELPKDALLLVTADHGLVDARDVYIADHPEIRNALIRPPTVEPRAAALYVKDEYKDRFPDMFRQAFGDDFLLMTGQEAIDKGLFGPGRRHERLPISAGDFMAFSLNEATLHYKRKEDRELIGVHAGLTEIEMRVPLIAVRGHQ